MKKFIKNGIVTSAWKATSGWLRSLVGSAAAILAKIKNVQPPNSPCQLMVQLFIPLALESCRKFWFKCKIDNRMFFFGFNLNYLIVFNEFNATYYLVFNFHIFNFGEILWDYGSGNLISRKASWDEAYSSDLKFLKCQFRLMTRHAKNIYSPCS